MTSPLPGWPVLFLEAGLGAPAPVAGLGAFILDDPVNGKLDTGLLSSAVNWSDITAYAITVSVSRPSTRVQGPLNTYQPGTLSVVLDNSDGRFDPDNTASPYYPNLLPMVPVRFRARLNGVDYYLFSGFADGWQPSQVTYEGGYAELNLNATDGFKILGGQTLAAIGAAGAGELSGARVTRILNSAAWYSDHRKIAAGDSPLQATTYGSDALSLLQLTADTEAGELYADGAGNVVFRNRHAILTDTRSAAAQGVFGDLSGMLHPAAGNVGAFLDESGMGAADLNAALASWQTWTGDTIRSVRVYLGASSFAYTSDLSQAAAAGIKVCLTLRPAYNPVSATDLANMTTLLTTMQAAGLKADITFWHEPVFSGLTSVQYINMVQYYGPAVRAAGYPLVFCTSAAAVNANSENTYWPGDAYIDKVASDIYLGSTSHLGDGTTQDPAYHADTAPTPKPFGIWEFGTPVNWLTGALANFEGNIGSWTGSSPVFNCTAASTGAQFHGGTGSMSMTSGAAGNMTAAHCGAAAIATAGMPCTSGDTVTGSVWVRAQANPRTCQAGAQWFNSSGTYLSDSYGTGTADTTTGWTQITFSVTAPANAAYCRISVLVQATGAANEVHYADDAVLNGPGVHTRDIAYFSTLQTYMAGRLAAGKTNADILWFNSTGGGGYSGIITSGADTRVPLYQAMFAALDVSMVATLPELAYASVTRASDDTQLATDVQITIAGGSILQEASDAAATAKFFFPRTYPRTDLLLVDDASALGYAQWVLALSKNGENRFSQITIDPNADMAGVFPQVLARDAGDRISVWHRPAGVPAPVFKDCFVRGIQHDIDCKASTWLTTWSLQDASRYAGFLILDDSVRGKLDSNSLAY